MREWPQEQQLKEEILAGRGRGAAEVSDTIEFVRNIQVPPCQEFLGVLGFNNPSARGNNGLVLPVCFRASHQSRCAASEKLPAFRGWS